MRQELRRSFALLTAFGVGAVQGWALRHLLVDCLPYKEAPFHDLYEMIGKALFFAGPVVAVVVALLLLRRQTALAPLVAAVSLPVAAFSILSLASFAESPSQFIEDSSEFGLRGCLSDFAFWAVGAALLGGVLASAASALLHLTRPEEEREAS